MQGKVVRVNDMEDVTHTIISDMRLSHNKDARESKPSQKLTAPQEVLLRSLHGVQLPYISNPLVYSNQMVRGMNKRQQKMVYSLVKGGYVKIMRVHGVPTNDDVRRESPYATAHYVLVTSVNGFR